MKLINSIRIKLNYNFCQCGIYKQKYAIFVENKKFIFEQKCNSCGMEVKAPVEEKDFIVEV